MGPGRRPALLIAATLALVATAPRAAGERAPTAVAAPAPMASNPASIPASIPFRKEPSVEIDTGRMVLALVLAIAAAAAALYVVRRRQGVAPDGAPRGRRLRVVERLRVSPRTTLLLVEYDGQVLLLGEQQGTLVRIDGGAHDAAAPGSGA